MKQKTKKHEPIIWENERAHGSLKQFYECAKRLNMDYIIYVCDAAGGNKSVWACHKTDFTDCAFTFSKKFFFGTVMHIHDAITSGLQTQQLKG